VTQRKKIIFWFRRDLRLDDNAGLYHALLFAKNTKATVIPLFIFDIHILKKLPQNDARVSFIYNTLIELDQELKLHGSSLRIEHGKPEVIINHILKTNAVQAIYSNRDYEPYARTRDERIQKICAAKNVTFNSFKDQVIFETSEILTQSNTPYTIFTPYSKAWKKHLDLFYYKAYPSKKYLGHLDQKKIKQQLDLEKIGFLNNTQSIPHKPLSPALLKNYEKNRNFPALDGTSHIGIHLRFGTLSIRKAVNIALKTGSNSWLNELIWREFFMQILWHFPHVMAKAFKPKYDSIHWRNHRSEFKKWCEGKTGYPLVDAGMRELNATGYMHNRLRMVTASFLTKHLLVDWRWGERYFAQKLLDFELASNNGNWQWAAGTGCDAAPYFRIFNPITQLKKFDAQNKYISKWLSDHEIQSLKPMVDHDLARERCLKAYITALK